MTLDQISKLLSQMQFLQQQLLLQTAKTQAIEEYLASLTESVGGIKHNEAHRELHRLTRLKYDKMILDMGDSRPEWASSVDIRPMLDGGEKLRWEFPEEG
jgi:hypothetical protein